MKRRTFLGGFLVGLALAGPALAADVVESIIKQLKKQGFRSIEQERTLLGRVRIVADRRDGSREIIVNPRTGEILRDLWTPLDGSSASSQIINDPADGGGNQGGGGHDGGNHDDDVDEDDDEDEDNDHGGGGSGGGSGGNGGGGNGQD